MASSDSATAKSESAPKSGGFGLGMIGNLFGGSAQPAATTTASNAAPTPQAPAPAPNAPFYKRWLGLGEADAAAAVEPSAVPQPAKVPLPPKRQAQAPGTAQIAMTTQQ